jgi:hypothetical protein
MHPAVDHELLGRLLRQTIPLPGAAVSPTEPGVGGDGVVRFLQEGVHLKGNPQDDKRTFVGTILLLEDSSVVRPSTGAAVVYLLWVPYRYLENAAPHLVSPAAKRALISGDSTGSFDMGSFTDPSSPQPQDFPIEFNYIVAVDVMKLRKLQRRTNLRGKRIVILTRSSGHIENPLIFNEGGQTKFVDELKKITPLKQNPSQADEYLFPEVDEEDLKPNPTQPSTLTRGSRCAKRQE